MPANSSGEVTESPSNDDQLIVEIRCGDHIASLLNNPDSIDDVVVLPLDSRDVGLVASFLVSLLAGGAISLASVLVNHMRCSPARIVVRRKNGRELTVSSVASDLPAEETTELIRAFLDERG